MDGDGGTDGAIVVCNLCDKWCTCEWAAAFQVVNVSGLSRSQEDEALQ